MKVARIVNNIVREIIPEYGLPVEQWYGEEFAKLCEEVPDEAQCGWIKVNDEWVSPNVVNLDKNKHQCIQQSKLDLANYLESHPLQWTDGEYYSITSEKQQQLTSKIMAATMAQTLSTDYTLTWNSTGEVCKEWTISDLAALAFAIDARVTALVTYQQTQEVAMRNATTQEELDAIVVDYDSVV